MIVATFGPSTAWVGKSITYDGGLFTLEGHGQIEPGAVVDYDRQGHLQWAYDGLREWTYRLAGAADLRLRRRRLRPRRVVSSRGRSLRWPLQ